MRPVERGDWPVHGVTGLPVEFTDYGEAKPALLDRLGHYCSYCEMPIQNSPAVEHVQPKSLAPDLERMWCNFLLSCVYCNSSKLATHVSLSACFWPDQDNTARAFRYAEPWLVDAAPGLGAADAQRAGRTIHLVGLDKVPGAPRRPSDSDPRWRFRKEAWEKAVRAKSRIAGWQGGVDVIRDLAIDLAKATGFWSVWMAVFDDDPEMKRLLIREFPCTATGCFDEQGSCVSRRSGAL